MDVEEQRAGDRCFIIHLAWLVMMPRTQRHTTVQVQNLYGRLDL